MWWRWLSWEAVWCKLTSLGDWTTACAEKENTRIMTSWRRRKSEPKNRNEPKNQKWVGRVMTQRWVPEVGDLHDDLNSVPEFCVTGGEELNFSRSQFPSWVCFDCMIHMVFYNSNILVFHCLYTHILTFSMFVEFITAKHKCAWFLMMYYNDLTRTLV